MKQLPVFLILLSLVACGERDLSSAPENEMNPRRTCDTSKSLLCTQPLTYILNTRLTNVNENIRLDIIRDSAGNEEYRYTAADACKKPGVFRIVSNTTGTSIFFEGMPMMGRGATLELIDQGEDCKGNTVIVKTKLSDDDIRADQSSNTMNVDLD